MGGSISLSPSLCLALLSPVPFGSWLSIHLPTVCFCLCSVVSLSQLRCESSALEISYFLVLFFTRKGQCSQNRIQVKILNRNVLSCFNYYCQGISLTISVPLQICLSVCQSVSLFYVVWRQKGWVITRFAMMHNRNFLLCGTKRQLNNKVIGGCKMFVDTDRD